MLRKLISLTVCLLLLTTFGCPEGGEYRELGEGDNVSNTSPPEHHDHSHGPHDGHILELGDYHGELTFENGIATLYILGADAATATPVTGGTAVLKLKSGDEVQEITLVANPEEGETDGATSKFISEAGKIPDSVKDIEGLAGDVVLTVGEKSVSSSISHDHHDHHDH